MTRGQARERRRAAWDAFVTAWGVATIPNALVAFGVEMNGGWLVLRAILSAIATVALAVLIAAFVRERLAAPEPTA